MNISLIKKTLKENYLFFLIISLFFSLIYYYNFHHYTDNILNNAIIYINKSSLYGFLPLFLIFYIINIFPYSEKNYLLEFLYSKTISRKDLLINYIVSILILNVLVIFVLLIPNLNNLYKENKIIILYFFLFTNNIIFCFIGLLISVLTKKILHKLSLVFLYWILNFVFFNFNINFLKEISIIYNTFYLINYINNIDLEYLFRLFYILSIIFIVVFINLQVIKKKEFYL